MSAICAACRVPDVVVSYELVGEDATLDHTSCLSSDYVLEQS